MAAVTKSGLRGAFTHVLKSLLPQSEGIQALLLVVVIVGLYFGVLAVPFPILVDDPRAGDFAISALTYFLALVAEKLGLRPRILGLPIWLLALISWTAQFFKHFGLWAGLGALLPSVFVVFVSFRLVERPAHEADPAFPSPPKDRSTET